MEPWKDQRTPALAIVARGDQIRERSPTEYFVRSQSEPAKAHTVVNENGEWACDCQHHQEAKRACVHILATKFRLDFLRQNQIPDGEAPVCPSCRSASVVSNGKRFNKTGAVRRWLCRSCGYKFTGDDGFRNRRADPEKIATAIDLYFRGTSFRNVADHLKQAHGLAVSAMTVYRWVAHYSRLVAEWLDRQAPSVGSTWHVDETVVNVDGQHRYLWNVMDRETRYLLAIHISQGRGMDDTRAPLKKAKAATPNRPTEVRTDGMMAYHSAVGAEFGRIGGPGSTGWVNPHRRVPSIRAKDSNNRVERLHGTEKDRIKTMRAFDHDKGAAILAEGFRAHYNAVRPHIGLDGRTPAEAAGVSALGLFKWLDLLGRSRKDGNQ